MRRALETPMTRLGRLAAGLVTAAVIALASAAGALAHTESTGELTVIHPWAKPAAEGQSTTAQASLSNSGPQPRVLTSVTTGAAESVAIIVDGREVSALAIPADTTFGADKFHLRMDGLTRVLEDGAAFEVTLAFDDGTSVDFEMVVGQDTMSPDGGSDG